jgi:hypothetical protein
LRPAWHDIVGSSVSSCKFKPIQQQLKIVVGTNVASPNIDLDHAVFPQVEQSFNSVQVPSSASYFAGFWTGTQDRELLQLVPLTGVLQMRPDFKYIDESAQAQLRLNAEQDKAEEQETIDISDGDDANDDPVYVQASASSRNLASSSSRSHTLCRLLLRKEKATVQSVCVNRLYYHRPLLSAPSAHDALAVFRLPRTAAGAGNCHRPAVPQVRQRS